MQVKDNLISGAIILLFSTVAVFVFSQYTYLASGTLSISAVSIFRNHFLSLVTIFSFLMTGVIGAVLYRVARQRYHDYHLLVKSEAKYRRVVHNAAVGIAVIQDDLLKYANPRLSDMFGYPLEGSLPRSFTDFLHPVDRESAVAAYKRATGDGVFSLPSVVRINDYSNRERWIETNGVAIDWEGRPAILHFVRDITEEKTAKDALVQSEQHYRSLVENLNDVVFILDERGFITYISPVIESLSGFTNQELIGQDFRRFIHPDDLKELEEGSLENIGRDYASHEFRVFDSRGVVHLVRASSRVTMEEGVPVRVNGIVADISDRKRAEEALARSEKRYRELVENLDDAIFILDGEGNFKFINRVIEKIAGYRPEEMIGRHYRGFVTERSYHLVERHSEASPRDGTVETFEIEVYHKDRDTRTIECKMTPVWEDDRAVEFHVIGRDVTERTRMSRWLVQAERLSSLGGILSGVAHELNNPLCAVLGNAQLLMRKELPSDIREKLTVIEKESKRSTKIVGGLLAFARGNKPERSIVEIGDVIRDSYQLMEYELRVNNVTMLLDVGPDIPPTLLDPNQIKQVFINLITNAYHALLEKGGGSLSIRSYHLEDKVFIEFADDGPGISPENLKRIFDPFFTTKEPGKGTGLGLSIVYGIIHEHGGSIQVASQPGHGAVFTVVLPIIWEGTSREEPMAAITEKPRGRKVVLVVDDEESFRKMVVEALAEEGYAVDSAESGEQALELLRSHAYDAVVMDMRMPGLTGEELYRSIQGKDPKLASRIIISTGDVLGNKTQNFLRITGARSIEKPFEIKELLSVVWETVRD
jgi:PAS domain S-box-containing protein